jgi:hypothetical protein
MATALVPKLDGGKSKYNQLIFQKKLEQVIL